MAGSSRIDLGYVESGMLNLLEDTKRQNDHVKKLTEYNHSLKRKNERLIEKKENLEKWYSSSRDARKMYGDMTPGDITHQDVTLAYQNHFKEAFRILPKQLYVDPDTAKDKKYEVWSSVSSTFMESFEHNKDIITETVANELQEALLDTAPLNENSFDLCRAFKLIMDENKTFNSELGCISEQVQAEMKTEGYDNETIQFYTGLAVDIINSIQPQSYGKFVSEIPESKSDIVHQSPPRVYNRGDTSGNRGHPSGNKGPTSDHHTSNDNKRKVSMSTEDAKKTGDWAGAVKNKFSENISKTRRYKCDKCLRTFEDGNLLTWLRGNKGYCKNCLCTKCKKPVEDEPFSTEIGLFHRHCLACMTCRRQVKDNCDVISLGEGRYQCQECYEANK